MPNLTEASSLPAQRRPFVEVTWRHITDTYDPDWVAVVSPWAIHTVLYFVFGIFWLCIERMPWMDVYRVQKKIKRTWSDYARVFRIMILNNTIAWGLTIGMMFAAQQQPVDMSEMSFDTIPPWWSIVVSVLGCLVIDDAYSYFIHRVMHHRYIYKYAHKMHHEIRAPFALSSEYESPIENIASTPGIFVATWLCCDHLAAVMAFSVVRTWHQSIMHCGYNLPWLNPMELLPYYQGVMPHDLHHSHPFVVGNFARTFTYWDRMLGTFMDQKMLQKYKEELKANGAKAKIQ